VTKWIRLDTGKLQRKDILVKSDKLNNEIEHKSMTVKKKKSRKLIKKEVKIDKLNQLFITVSTLN
jgi:hypothetical protein